MSDRGRYDSAMFWLALGTASAVIGLALMTIGVSRSPAGANLLASPWFDAGLGLLGLGALLLLWALGLYLARRRTESELGQTGLPPETRKGRKDRLMDDAVKGYYNERNRLFKMWERDRNRKKPPKLNP